MGHKNKQKHQNQPSHRVQGALLQRPVAPVLPQKPRAVAALPLRESAGPEGIKLTEIEGQKVLAANQAVFQAKIQLADTLIALEIAKETVAEKIKAYRQVVGDLETTYQIPKDGSEKWNLDLSALTLTRKE